MTKYLNIADVTGRTGLSARALRFYEARGLVKPLRTASGRRIYAAGDLERVHQIIALKAAGLSLADIHRLLSGTVIDLATLLKTQLEVLNKRAAEVAEARELITQTLSRIDRGEPIDAATFCSLIRHGDTVMTQENWKKVVDQYWSPEAQDQFNQRAGDMQGSAMAPNGVTQWADLGARIKAALPLDPLSDHALAFVREWFALLAPFTKVATKEMWESSANMYKNMDKWEGDMSPGFDKQVWDFVQQATAAAKAAGHDVGPMPSHLQ